MGYTTHFYVTDLAKLASVIGCKDEKLRDRIRERIIQLEGPPSRPDIGILVTLDGEIYVNGKQMTPEELQTDLRKPEHAGRGVSYFKRESRNAEEGRRKGASRFPSEAKFVQFLQQALHDSGVRYSFLSNCTTEETLLKESGDELTIENATDQLVFGEIDLSSDSAYQYGYALEYVCREISVSELTLEGKRRLSNLKLKSKVFKHRCPVEIPDYDDFPEIGYLTSEEAKSELMTVFSRELLVSLPPDLHQERDQLISLVTLAATEGLSLIGFCY